MKMITLLQRYFFALSAGTALLFVLVSLLLVSPNHQDFLYSSSIQRAASNVSSITFLDAMGMEIPSLHRTVQAQGEPESSTMQSFFFQLITGIYPGDLRSLLGRELPGLLTYDDARIIVPGQGLELVDLYVESAAPNAVVQDVNREENTKARDIVQPGQVEKDETKTPSPPIIAGEKRVFIYNTHNRESWTHVAPTVGTSVDHPTKNIQLVGKRFGKLLQEKGVNTIVSENDFIQQLIDQKKTYPMAYAESYKAVKAAAQKNPALQYYFDIHRDGDVPRSKTAITINGKTYARILFVIGTRNRNFMQNERMAKELNALVEKKYPGLSRGVIAKGAHEGNAEYNQSISPGSLLLEFGGINNTLEESYNTAEAFADVFAEYYQKAEKVNKEQTPKSSKSKE